MPSRCTVADAPTNAVRYDDRPVVGRGAWLAGALLGYVVACNVTTGPFTCADDGDCILQGTPGVCDGDGRCSYPDDACSSGYSYPAATPGVGGDCAPDPGVGDASTGGPVGTSTSDDDATGSVAPGSTGDGTTVQLDSAGSSDSASSDDGLESSGGDVTTSTSTTAEPMCEDDVPNSADEAVVFPGCIEGAGQGTIVDSSDEDWWSLGGPGGGCNNGEYSAALKAQGLEVCLFFQCGGIGSGPVECLVGTEAGVSGMNGCCDSQYVVAAITCGISGNPVPRVRVMGENAECSEYLVGVGLAD